MILKYGLDEEEKWNEIVKSFKNYDVYYIADYLKAFKVHGDGEPTLFYYEGENIRAFNVVMLRDISTDKNFGGLLDSGTYFDISTPYGYGGFIIEGQVTDENIRILDEEYILICKKYGIISEVVRFHPVFKNVELVKNMYDVTELGKTININLESQEQIWADIAAKNRNVIRKAKKSNVEIYWGRDPNLIHKFKEVYEMTMDRDEADEYYYFKDDFYISVLKDLKYNSMIFYAVYEEKIISISMILFANNQMHYHLSASNKEFQYLAPTNLLLYEAANWGVENGFESFHLGGGLGSNEDSLYKFKKVFNKKSDLSFSLGKKIINKEKYDELILIRKESSDFNEESQFFPLYRA